MIGGWPITKSFREAALLPILGASAVEGLQSTGLTRLLLLIGSIEMFNWVTKKIAGLLFHHVKCGVCGF